MYKQFYPNLQKPIKIRNLLLRNRIMSAPNLIFRNIDGRPDEYYIGYLEHKARGGASIVTLGEANVCDGGNHTPEMEKTLQNLTIFSEIVHAIHEHGAVASVELTHGGMNVKPEFNKDLNLIMGPSANKNARHGANAREMTEADMEFVANGYADTAEYYFHAGFDSVHLHFGHGWLMAQFLSPIVNRRTDDYGGSFENRMRFPLYVLKKVRERVGDQRAITIRVPGSERHPDGFTTEDIIEFLAKAQEYADMVEVSTEDFRYITAPTYIPPGVNVQYAEQIKKSGRISIPVFVVGSIINVEQMEKIIASGAADGVSVARALIADPFLPRKAFTGRADEITPCLRCLHCTRYDNTDRHYVCSVNPFIAREARYGFCDSIVPAKHKDSVLIVGAGPAGMQAAVTAAERGHRVTLAESGPAIGGLLRFTEKDTVKHDLRDYTEYLIRKTNRARVNILLNTEVTDDLIEKVQPDHIIVATGGVPIVPDIKGVEKARHATDIYFDPEFEPGERTVIIGGGLVGSDAGLHLINLGKKVTVLELADAAAHEETIATSCGLPGAIERSGMSIITSAKALEITDAGVIYEKNGETVTIQADTVLYAVGTRHNEKSYFDFYDKAPFVTLIGDAKNPGKVDGAVQGGFFAAMDI